MLKRNFDLVKIMQVRTRISAFLYVIIPQLKSSFEIDINDFVMVGTKCYSGIEVHLTTTVKINLVNKPSANSHSKPINKVHTWKF